MFKLVQHNENVFVQKSGFFLLAESIFILAYVQPNNTGSLLTLSIVGLVLTLFWLIWGLNHYSNTKILISELKERSGRNSAVQSGNEEGKIIEMYFWWRERSTGGAHRIFGILFPLAFVVLWIYLLLPNLA